MGTSGEPQKAAVGGTRQTRRERSFRERPNGGEPIEALLAAISADDANALCWDSSRFVVKERLFKIGPGGVAPPPLRMLRPQALRRISLGLEPEHVEAPGAVIDEEAVVDKVAAVAVVTLRTHHIYEARLLAAKFLERQPQ
jgi:hypothetical protein